MANFAATTEVCEKRARQRPRRLRQRQRQHQHQRGRQLTGAVIPSWMELLSRLPTPLTPPTPPPAPSPSTSSSMTTAQKSFHHPLSHQQFRRCRPLRPSHWPFIAVFVVMLCGSLLPVSQQTKQKFCGKSLTEAMDLVCVNGYNDKISSTAAAQKRQANGFPVSQILLDDGNDDDDAAAAAAAAADGTALDSSSPTLFLFNSYPAVGPLMYANILAKTRYRRTGGVYDECCRKACSYAELAAYCRSVTSNK